MPVVQAMTMSAAEYEGWRHHRMRYPPAEYILAALWLTVSRALGNDEAKAEDMGDWLETPETRRAREADEAAAEQKAKAAFVSAAYRQGKEDD